MRMHNPAHPGEILREQIGEMPVTEFAKHLRVSRVTLSRLLNGSAGISAAMALKLSEALGTSPELWLNLQTQFDLWNASRARREKVPQLTGLFGKIKYDPAYDYKVQRRRKRG
jgi:addiction module HigA family antidote